MSSASRAAMLPAFILLSLALGGSAQAIWGNFLLQLQAIAILAWVALSSRLPTVPYAGKTLGIIVGLAFLLIMAQLLPLPQSVWTRLAVREEIVDAFALLNFELGWMPISLTPFKTLDAILFLLPPLAVLAASLTFESYRESWMVIALLAGTFGGILLGILQVTTTDQSWYLYRYSSVGAATGFFANSNHMATLLLASWPFLIALACGQWVRVSNVQWRALILAMAFGGGAVILIGLALNGSFAVLLLSAPVGLASILLLPVDEHRNRRRYLLAAAMLAAMMTTAISFKAEIQSFANNSVESRFIIWKKSTSALSEHWVLGSGIGSFREIYQQEEKDSAIENSYVNHVHNDYFELVIETGIAGALILIGFLLWWGHRVITVWRSDSGFFARAATISSSAILSHSIVDYPLRTTAIASLMAMCLAMMARLRPAIDRQNTTDMWPTRHLTIN